MRRPRLQLRQCRTCRYRNLAMHAGQTDDGRRYDWAWCPRCGTLHVVGPDRIETRRPALY